MAKKRHGRRANASAADALGDLTMERLPKGVEPRAAFILVKTTQGWYTRAVGGKAFKDLEFTSQLASTPGPGSSPRPSAGSRPELLVALGYRSYGDT